MSLPTRGYREARFSAAALARGLVFRGPAPGSEVPDLDLHDAEDGVVRLRGRERPVLLSFVSLTCPMTATAAGPLRRLHRQYGDEVDFVSVYVREAHPGELIGQAATLEEKRARARAYRARDRVAWTVAVDGLDGPFHRAMGEHPNAAYLIDGGRVIFRALWSSDEPALAEALEAAALGKAPPRAESRACLQPLLAGLGALDDVLRRAGDEARRDLLRAAPPVYGLARLASWFKPLPPDQRGAAAVLAAGAGLAALAVAARRRTRA